MSPLCRGCAGGAPHDSVSGMTETELTTSVTDVEQLKKCLEVEVPASVVTARLDRALKDLQQRVRVRGFRPGKAPRTVLGLAVRRRGHRRRDFRRAEGSRVSEQKGGQNNARW